jgi:hypothetical protein
VTRFMRVFVIAVAVAFAAGCAHQGKPKASSANNKLVTANEKAATSSKTKPSSPVKPEATKPGVENAKPQAKPESQRPANMERPKVTKIEADKVGLPIYPGAQVLNAQEMTWSKGPMGVLRTAMLTSTDAPDKILKWYRDRVGGKAQIEDISPMSDNRKGAYVYYRNADTGTIKSVSVIWTAEKPGVATDIKIHLNVRQAPPKADTGGRPG